jgi:hypothetical protein
MGDDTPFDEAAFAATFTDRGASLGAYDETIARLFEPMHRLHLAILNVTSSYAADDVARTACKAAYFAASSAVFQAYLCGACPSVTRISALLWQKPSNARFASSLAACYVLSRRVDGKPLYTHVAEFMDRFKVSLKGSTVKMTILEVFQDPDNRRKIDNLGLLFSGVVYPIVRLLAAAAAKPQTSQDAVRKPADVGWLNEVFRFLAFKLFRPGDLTHVVNGTVDVFGNAVLCGFEEESCSFKCTSDDAVLPRVRKVTDAELHAVQPEDLRKYGLSKYFGNKGVKKSKTLIPAVSDATPQDFLASAMLRMATAFYSEVERYGPTKELEKVSCDIGLGPMIVEGVCGRAKRVCQNAGHARTRDELVRAMVCAKETWWGVSREVVSAETLKTVRLATEPETTGARKARLGAEGMTRLNKERATEQGRADRRNDREERMHTTPLIFSFNRLWKADLLVQVNKRGENALYQAKTVSLRAWLQKYDTNTMPPETLREEANIRGDKNAHKKERKVMLRFLRSIDKRKEEKRFKAQKEERKQRKRKREEEEEEEEEDNPEEETEEDEWTHPLPVLLFAQFLVCSFGFCGKEFLKGHPCF